MKQRIYRIRRQEKRRKMVWGAVAASVITISSAFFVAGFGDEQGKTIDEVVIQETETFYVGDLHLDRFSGEGTGSLASGTEDSPLPEYAMIDRSNERIREHLRRGVVDEDFLAATEDMCARYRIHAMALYALMAHETGNSFDPGIRNRSSNAVGLIQLTRQNARMLGTNIWHLASLDRNEQLEYVGRYYEITGHTFRRADFTDPADVVTGNWLPGRMHRAVLTTRGDVGYNSGAFDLNHDGRVMRWEYASSILHGYVDRGG